MDAQADLHISCLHTWQWHVSFRIKSNMPPDSLNKNNGKLHHISAPKFWIIYIDKIMWTECDQYRCSAFKLFHSNWQLSKSRYNILLENQSTQCLPPTNRIQQTSEPQHDKTNECAHSEVSDQSGHPPGLIRVFAVRMKKAWVLSYPLSAQRRLWSDWADAQDDLSLRWALSNFVGFVMSQLNYMCK